MNVTFLQGFLLGFISLFNLMYIYIERERDYYYIFFNYTLFGIDIFYLLSNIYIYNLILIINQYIQVYIIIFYCLIIKQSV